MTAPRKRQRTAPLCGAHTLRVFQTRPSTAPDKKIKSLVKLSDALAHSSESLVIETVRPLTTRETGALVSAIRARTPSPLVQTAADTPSAVANPRGYCRLPDPLQRSKLNEFPGSPALLPPPRMESPHPLTSANVFDAKRLVDDASNNACSEWRTPCWIGNAVRLSPRRSVELQAPLILGKNQEQAAPVLSNFVPASQTTSPGKEWQVPAFQSFPVSVPRLDLPPLTSTVFVGSPRIANDVPVAPGHETASVAVHVPEITAPTAAATLPSDQCKQDDVPLTSFWYNSEADVPPASSHCAAIPLHRNDSILPVTQLTLRPSLHEWYDGSNNLTAADLRSEGSQDSLFDDDLPQKLTQIEWMLQTYRRKLRAVERPRNLYRARESNISVYSVASSDSIDEYDEGDRPRFSLKLLQELQNKRIEALETQVNTLQTENKKLQSRLQQARSLCEEAQQLEVERDALAQTVLTLTHDGARIYKDNQELRQSLETSRKANSELARHSLRLRAKRHSSSLKFRQFCGAIGVLAREISAQDGDEGAEILQHFEYDESSSQRRNSNHPLILAQHSVL